MSETARKRSGIEPLALRLESPGIVALALAVLPAIVHPAASYVRSLAEAARRLRGRDVDDADVLALALHVDAPVWSNEHDFDGTGVDVHTTARFLRRFCL